MVIISPTRVLYYPRSIPMALFTWPFRERKRVRVTSDLSKLCFSLSFVPRRVCRQFSFLPLHVCHLLSHLSHGLVELCSWTVSHFKPLVLLFKNATKVEKPSNFYSFHFFFSFSFSKTKPKLIEALSHSFQRSRVSLEDFSSLNSQFPFTSTGGVPKAEHVACWWDASGPVQASLS